MLQRSRQAPVGRRRWAVLVLLSLGAWCAWGGQQPKPPTPEVGGFIFRAETRLVVLHATVVDKSNHFVTNLRQSAFRVFENGVEQTLKVFHREDVPVSVGIIVDNSGSMRDKREKVNAAALAFVKASHPQDEVFIVNFNDEAFLDQDFTNSQDLLQDGLKKIDQRGGTAFYDALSMSLDHLKEKAKKDKKVILLITDGEDNASQMTLEKLLRKVGESEAAIFTVGLLNEEERRAQRRTKRALSNLAEASGGAAFFPKDVGEVDEIAHKVAADIRNQYTLGYTPINQAEDGSFRQVKVTLVGAGKNYAVRTRTGYYARGAGSSAPKPGPPSSQLR
ncbi:MAG: VWA domain-containing protein [Acidobacteria bacterium]|nr:VWA domain-containing protein [Acidobacteriota bacterium]